MTLEVQQGWAVSVFLVFVRLGAFLALTPILSGSSVPLQARILLTLALTALMVSALDVPASAVPDGFAPLLVSAASEVALGAVMAFGVFAAFAAFTMAGKLVDIQVGFGLGSVFDPVTRRQSPVLTTAFDLLAVTVFFAIDGHHALLRGFAYSLQQLPPGTPLGSLSPAAVARQFGATFTFGIALVAPVVFCVFLAEIGLAMLSRVMPQMHIFVLGMPVKIVVGLSVLALSAPYMAPLIGKVFLSIFAYWQEVLA